MSFVTHLNVTHVKWGVGGVYQYMAMSDPKIDWEGDESAPVVRGFVGG